MVQEDLTERQLLKISAIMANHERGQPDQADEDDV